MSEPGPALLELRGLRAAVRTPRGQVPILRGVDLRVRRGEILGLIGESGAGKSLTARAILGLLGTELEQCVDDFRFDGERVVTPGQLARLLGRRIGFVPQNPRASLNPVFTIGDQLSDAIRRLRRPSRLEVRAEALRSLREVQIPDPERRLGAFPHELSGGMCQRVCMAIALSGRPDLIIADEPTTGLDVTTQAEILALLLDLIRQDGAAGILITHNVGVVAEVCDWVAVMYAGRVVEEGSPRDLFSAAMHPYAARLFDIATSLDRGREPEIIPGQVPQPADLGQGCAFAPRCFRATATCLTDEPPRVKANARHAFCHHPLC